MANIFQHLPAVTGTIFEIQDRDNTTLVLETDRTTLFGMDVHVATLIRGNNALVTKVQLTKTCVLTLVATDWAMIGGAQVVTTEGIKVEETEKQQAQHVWKQVVQQ